MSTALRTPPLTPPARQSAVRPAGVRPAPVRAAPIRPAPVRPGVVRAAAAPTVERAPRLAPFVLLVVGLLGAGLVAMLLLNTVLAQGAFREAGLSSRSALLGDDLQRFTAANAREASSEVLAAEAAKLGLVGPGCGPQFISLRTGRTLGGVCSSSKPGAPAAASVRPGPSSKSATRATAKPTARATTTARTGHR